MISLMLPKESGLRRRPKHAVRVVRKAVAADSAKKHVEVVSRQGLGHKHNKIKLRGQAFN